MKAEFIVNQLKTALPLLTDYFNDVLNVTSMTRVGSTVTVITATAHGLTTGDIVSITGATTPVQISSITRVGTIATATTVDNHDLTEGWQSEVLIEGADQEQYNGLNSLLSVPNRRTFTFEVLGSPATPATGTMYLYDDYFFRGYNGRYAVTVINATTFTYETTKTPLSPAQGTIKVKKNPRVSSAVNIERMLESYTAQADNKLWAFVELQDVLASKDRYIRNDASATMHGGNAWRQRLITPFSVYIFTPTTNSLSASSARDLMQDISVYLFRSLLGFKFPTGYAEETWAQVTFVSHGFYEYTPAFYVHRFNFETVLDLIYEDTVGPNLNVAFRDIHLDFLKNSNVIMTSDINLDVEPV